VRGPADTTETPCRGAPKNAIKRVHLTEFTGRASVPPPLPPRLPPPGLPSSALISLAGAPPCRLYPEGPR
jgi:hypothetical protein